MGANTFSDLVDAILPKGGAVAMLQSYFDASRREGGFFCVAGYLFTKSQVKAFTAEWMSPELFGPYGGCHMKELTQKRGRFHRISQPEADRLIKSAVRVISQRIKYGVMISCELPEINALLPSWVDQNNRRYNIEGFNHPYPVCCHMAMSFLGGRLAHSGSRAEIAYFFESGDDGSSIAHRFMEFADKSPELKQSYRHHSHTFIAKEKAPPLHAADLLAWEWAKYLDETHFKKKRLMRLSLGNLLTVPVEGGRKWDKRHDGRHLTGEPLVRYLDQIKELKLAELREAGDVL